MITIELKTHSKWCPEEVTKQVRDHSEAGIDGQAVRAAILLAPDALLRAINKDAIRTLSWSKVIDMADGTKSSLIGFAQEHWRRNVEQDFGLPPTVTPVSFEQLATQAGCLDAFQVHAVAHPEFAPVSALQGLRPGLEGAGFLIVLDHRQTRAIDGDTFADR